MEIRLPIGKLPGTLPLISGQKDQAQGMEEYIHVKGKDFYIACGKDKCIRRGK